VKTTISVPYKSHEYIINVNRYPWMDFRRDNLPITNKLLNRKKTVMKTAFLVVMCFLGAVATESNVANWQVRPDETGDFPTIQAAVFGAVHWDTVTLFSGTYTGPGNRNVDFLGKAIVVTSESDPGWAYDSGGNRRVSNAR